MQGNPKSGKKVVQTFMSVDPLADKFPQESPYVYCGNNPLKYIDPDGRQVIITGDEASTSKAVEQMQSRTTNLSFSRDPETGLISASGKAKTKEEKYMQSIIDNTTITVNIKAQNHNKIDENYTIGDVGGSFMGNTVTLDDNKTPTHVDATQYVNVNSLAKSDKQVSRPGNFIWHEIAEGFEGGVVSLGTGKSSPNSTLPETIFPSAHYNAGEFFPGTLIHTSTTKQEIPDLNGGMKTIYKKNYKLGRSIYK